MEENNQATSEEVNVPAPDNTGEVLQEGGDMKIKAPLKPKKLVEEASEPVKVNLDVNPNKIPSPEEAT